MQQQRATLQWKGSQRQAVSLLLVSPLGDDTTNVLCSRYGRRFKRIFPSKDLLEFSIKVLYRLRRPSSLSFSQEFWQG
jgi:hypothetical protein